MKAAKKIFVILVFSCLLTALTSCHKTCVCYGYNGGEYSYTQEDLDARGKTCSGMAYLGSRQHYSVCNWE